MKAERTFAERSKSLLTNKLIPWKWWSTVETEVFGASSSLAPLVNKEGKLIWSADEKVSLFLTHFDVKLCRDSYQQPYSCDPSLVSLVLRSVAFQSRYVRSLLLNLDPYGGNDSGGMFPLYTSRWLRSWHLSWL